MDTCCVASHVLHQAPVYIIWSREASHFVKPLNGYSDEFDFDTFGDKKHVHIFPGKDVTISGVVPSSFNQPKHWE